MKAEEIVKVEDNEEEKQRLGHELSVLEQKPETQKEGVEMVRTEIIEDERVHSYELEQRDILAEDDVEGRLADSLKICLKNCNQHSDMMIEMKRKVGQHTKMLTEEGKALRPCELILTIDL